MINTTSFFQRWNRANRATYYCDASTISSGVYIGHLIDLICQKNCNNLNEVVASTRTKCIAFSAKDNWSYGLSSFDYTFPIKDDIEIVFKGSDWADLVLGGSNWEFRLKFSTTNRSDTSAVNSTPQTLLPPIMFVRQGISYTIKIPTVDNDITDIVKCRWSLSSNNECGGNKLKYYFKIIYLFAV